MKSEFLQRVIGHIDLDYFYAQVEEVENPALKERPVIVCVFSGRTEDSGVVSTANYVARGFGVRSGMPIVNAKKLLQGKDPAVIRMNHEKYEVVSTRIMDALSEKVDVLEPTGIDEAFFDVTASTSGDFERARTAAMGIKEAILSTEHLTASVGLGRSKAVAKLGSDLAKPGGLKVVLPEQTKDFLGPLAVEKLYGVGPKGASLLKGAHISTIGQLAGADPQELEKLFGKKLSVYLLEASKGNDSDPVRGDLEPTQFSRIVTLKEDTTDVEEILSQLETGVGHVHEKLSSSGKSFRTLTAIGILTDLSTKTKSKTYETPVSDEESIRGGLAELFDEMSAVSDKQFRRVGVRVSGFTDARDQKSLSDFLQA